LIGKTLAHYEITGLLGKGGMGEVYRARDTRLDRDVALKVLPAAVAADPGRIERFEREARTVAGLSHPHIVHMYSVEQAEGLRFLTMELVEGEELAEVIERGAMSSTRALGVGIAVADALCEAHAKGIVHRDLKPANVMITAEGRVKVLDFGLAKLTEIEPEDDDATRALELTRQGSALGTVPYMSPEQLRGQVVDSRSDLFSLGILLYELAAGRRPFEGTNAADITSSILKDDPPSLPDLDTSIPPDLGAIVDACLAKDPAARPESAAVVRDQLLALRRDLDSDVDVTRPRSQESAAGRKAGRSRIALLGLAGFAVLALLGWWFLDDHDGAQRGERPIVAVLPFKNLGSAAEDYFAAGVTEEITSRLALIDGLGVISSTSARAYASVDMAIPAVGRELGAGYVLEGSIRWDKSTTPGRVRISPRLIRVSDDTNLWLENYEREVDQIFELQTAIAANIAEALDVTLLQPVREAIEQKPTQNLEAYEAYLRGQKQLVAPGFGREAFERGLQAFERAVALDPDFALAWARLASLRARTYHYGFDRSETRLTEAKSAAERALQLDPRLAEGHLALGYYYYWGTREYGLALDALERARQIQPNNGEVRLATAYVMRRQGAMDGAIELLERDERLSPRDPNVTVALGETYGVLRRYAKAEAALRRSISIAPEDPYPYTELALLHLRWKGDTQAARAALDAMPTDAGVESRRVAYLVALFDRSWDEALEVLASAPTTVFEAGSFYLPIALLQGMVHRLAGNEQAAEVAFRSARDRLEEELEHDAEDYRVHAALGLAEAGLGRGREAVAHAERAVASYPLAKDALGAPVQIVNLARVHAMLGDGEAAAAHLREALSIPSTLSVAWLENDPGWNNVRSSEAFEALLRDYRSP